MGILLLPDNRGEKTPYGSTRQLLIEEMDYLFPTIDLPVAIALLDLGKPGDFMEDIQPQSQPKAIEQPVDHAKGEKASPGPMTKEQHDPDPAASKRVWRSKDRILPRRNPILLRQILLKVFLSLK